MLRKVRQSLRRLFRRSIPLPPPTIQIIRREIQRLSMAEWRSDKGMVALAGKALATPGVRDMLDVLRFSGSPHNSMLGLEMDMKARAVWQARTEGYTSALNDLESLAVLETPPGPPVEATYGADEPTEPTTET